jgi:hypothetical protein
MIQPLMSRHRVALELRIAARKPMPMMVTRRVKQPNAHGFLDLGRLGPLESGDLSTSSESSSSFGAMTGTVDGSSARARGAFSIDPFCTLVGLQEKLPDRRLRAEWDLRSKLVLLLSEFPGDLWLGALPCVWAEVACAVGVASRPEPREREIELVFATLTGRGLLKSSPSSEPEDRLCIPTTVDGGSAVVGRVRSVIVGLVRCCVVGGGAT